MSRIRIRYSFHNVGTNSVITGTKLFPGNSYQAIVDELSSKLSAEKESIINKKCPGEDPGEWALLGFQEYAHWKVRKDRAKEV